MPAPSHSVCGTLWVCVRACCSGTEDASKTDPECNEIIRALYSRLHRAIRYGCVRMRCTAQLRLTRLLHLYSEKFRVIIILPAAPEGNVDINPAVRVSSTPHFTLGECGAHARVGAAAVVCVQ